jgi:hypothetical protein
MGNREVFTKSPVRRWRLPDRYTYYLDTGVLRRRSKKLIRSPLRHVAYTSAIALVELVAGVRRSEREFQKRKAAVEAVFAADLPVDWQFPEAKIACAYPRLREKYDIFETRCGSLQALVTALRTSRNVAQFSRRAEALDVPESLEFFERYDHEYAGDYVERAKRWPSESKMAFDPNSEPVRMLGLPPTVSHAEYLRAFRSSGLSSLVMQYGAAMGVGENEGLLEESAHDELFQTYDGSIDAYFRALSWWNIEHALGRTPNRNDALDLAHLVYLVPNATLVTTDRALAECAMNVGIPCEGPDSIVAGA